MSSCYSDIFCRDIFEEIWPTIRRPLECVNVCIPSTIHTIDTSCSPAHSSDILVEELTGKFQVFINMNDNNELEASTGFTSQESSIFLKVTDKVRSLSPMGYKNMIHFHQSSPPKKNCRNMKQTDGKFWESPSHYCTMLYRMHGFHTQETLIRGNKGKLFEICGSPH